MDELRERIAAYLAQNQMCVISTNGCHGAWSVAAQYQHHGLELDCRVPHWSDALFHLEQDPSVQVIILDAQSSPSHWLHYRGTARVDSSSTDERYATVHVTPERVDLMDESRGWGARDTLELYSPNPCK